MQRPALELADVIRDAGPSFLAHSRGWFTWLHLKVLVAILRCRTALLGGHVDACSRCGHQAISYNPCLMGSIFLWGVGRRNRRHTGPFRPSWAAATHHKLWGFCYVDAAIHGQCSTRRAHAREVLLGAEDAATFARRNQWIIYRRVRRRPRTRRIRTGKRRSLHPRRLPSQLLRAAKRRCLEGHRSRPA